MKNETWMKAMIELRRSNAAVPIPSGKKYRRKARTDKTNPTTMETKP